MTCDVENKHAWLEMFVLLIPVKEHKQFPVLAQENSKRLKENVATKQIFS